MNTWLMNQRSRTTALRSAMVAFLTVMTGVLAAPTASAEPGPKLTVPVAHLQAAAHCDDAAHSGAPSVLLIHGTGSTPDEAWGWNYELALAADGYGVCTVTLPNRAVGEFTTSAEYAVYAARYAYQVSGRKIAIIGHSQGGLMAAWIAKFWPDVATHATDVISFAGPMQGTQLANTLCGAGSCAPITWQMSMGSHLTTAATTAPLPKSTSFTSIGSLQDEVVFPQPQASYLNGAANMMLQTVCPTHVAEHGGQLSDAVGYALVMDALTHDGPANPARVGPAVCLAPTMPGVDPVGATGFANTLVGLTLGLFNVAGYVQSEPPLPSYAVAYGR